MPLPADISEAPKPGSAGNDNKLQTTDEVTLWNKRRSAAQSVYEEWVKTYRVKQCYNFWKGDQIKNPTDRFGNRKSIVNLIHADVAEQLPSLYFFRPFARITAQPELADTPGTQIDEQAQLMQDTVNHLIRSEGTRYDPSTRMATKEAHWALGIVEVGYEPDFLDNPTADRPALKEDGKTKGYQPLFPGQPAGRDPNMGVLDNTDMMELSEDDNLELELQQLKQSLRGEQFYVKHIPAKQFMISQSDKPILLDNDWVGYWEDVPVEDVKRSPAYAAAAKTLVARMPGDDETQRRQMEKNDEESGSPARVRLYKFWDLRNKTKIVIADGHPIVLYRAPFKRVPLCFLRFDIDPYHFLPIPPITHKLDSQVEYNLSRDYLRKVRNGTVPRYTYDEDALEAEQLRKLERGDMGTYIPRKGGTPGSEAIVPVSQPSLSENALQTLTLSAKEFQDVGSAGGNAQVSQTKTATQAKISEAKGQAQDSYTRVVVAEFLGAVAKELLMQAIDNMLLDQWVAINVAPDSMYSQMEAEKVSQSYKMITSEQLRSADSGIEWSLDVDIESLSPVSEEEKFQKWMQGLSFIGNPGMAMVFSASPELLKYTLKLMGLRSAREQELIQTSMDALMKQQQQQAAAAAAGGGSPPATPGVSPQPGSPKPGTAAPGGPQPGGPAGPGASTPA